MIGQNGAGAMNGAAVLAAPLADLATLPEAPASVTARVMYRGVDTMLTLRGLDGLSVLGRLDVALDWFEKHGATPATSTSSTSSTRPADSGPAPVCPTHGRPMKAGRKGGFFCPVKIADDDGAGKPVYCRQRINNNGGG